MLIDKAAPEHGAIRARDRANGERGQALILMMLAMTIILVIGVIAVDFGLWFSGRASVLNATDQATMAGSLALPTDGAAAEATARQYVQENDSEIADGDVVVSFRCIVGDRNHDGVPDSSDIPAVCPQVSAAAFTCINGLCYANCTFSSPSAKCNTIVTQASKDVPFGFGPIFGVDEGEATGYISAACRGACGGVTSEELDLVMIIDRTSSMCPEEDDDDDDCPDLDNAKAAALSVLEVFDPTLQHVALGVLGPSRTDSTCSGANSPALGRAASSANVPPATWLPVGLSDNYQNANGTLNTNSLIVKTINCLNASTSVGTNLGDPVKAAKDYLILNGRPGVKWGIILLTDGAANKPEEEDFGPVPGNTGPLNCGANAPVTSNSGDNNGYETTPGNACADGGGNAVDANSGTGNSTSCSSNQKDRHVFYNYGISLPGGATFTGIQVRLDASINSASGTRNMCVQLSWDGGVTWSSAQSTGNLSTSEQIYTLGGASSTWGHAWTTSQLSNANFRVRVTDVADGSGSASTATLQTVADGFYEQWDELGDGDGNREEEVDETSNFDCGSSDSIRENTTENRNSFTMDISSIPDGATITSVDVTVRDRGDSAAGGTYQAFARLNGSNTDSGANLTATGTSGCSATKTQPVNVADTVKSGSTTMEIGVVKTAGNTNAVRVGTVTAVVNYQLQRTFTLDRAAVQVHYTTPNPSAARGPCDYANQQATAAKALDPPIEIFTIGFGLGGARCDEYEDVIPPSPYYDVRVTKLLADMATQVSLDDGGGIGSGCDNPTEINGENADGDHFLCEARSGDLGPLFKAVAESFAGGSHLVSIPF